MPGSGYTRLLPPHREHETAHHAVGCFTAFWHKPETLPVSACGSHCNRSRSCIIFDHGIPTICLLATHICLRGLLLNRDVEACCCCGLGELPRCCPARSIAGVKEVPRAVFSPGAVPRRSALLGLLAAAGAGALPLLHGVPQRGRRRLLRCGGPLRLIVLAEQLLHMLEHSQGVVSTH